MSSISWKSFGRYFLERYLSILWNFPFVFSSLSHFLIVGVLGGLVFFVAWLYCYSRKGFDEDVAFLLGLHVGDGWLSDKRASCVRRRASL